MRRLTILIKPVSSLCNMDCQYCFYKDTVQYRKVSDCYMAKETYVSIIHKSLSFSKDPMDIEYCFQGGEPLLAGKSFYIDFIHEVNKMNQYHNIHYAIQTNGILIDEEWIHLFKENHFLVGISLDGIRKTHDFSRQLNGYGSFDKVIQSLDLLNENHIDYNILSVITSYMSNYAKDIYQFYKKKKFSYIQFIPCLPSFNGKGGLKPTEFSHFYKTLYDEYQKDQSIHIALFEQIEKLFEGKNYCSCGMIGYCMIQIVIEANGNIYPCDFYALDKNCLGNINDHHLKECIHSQQAFQFLTEDKNYSLLCDSCEFYKICQGNCKRQNVCLFDDYYCGYQDLLKYIKTKGEYHCEYLKE